MDRDAGKAVDANLKRITVPVYSTDPSRHLDYLDELRSHLHLLPESIAGLPGFKHGIVLLGPPIRFIPPPAGHADPANPVLPPN